MSIFEQASRAKLRFVTTKGALSVEDLWDLPLTSVKGVSLESVAQSVYKSLQETALPSFVNPTTTTGSKEDALRLELLKHVIAVRKDENLKAAQARENAAKRQRILQIMADRKEGALAQASDDELNKLLAELQ